MDETAPEHTKPKSDRQILQEQMEESQHEYGRKSLSLALSSTAAGLEIGFSFFLIAVLFTQFHQQVSTALLHLILAMSYPVGFILVIIGRSDLFTEHTTLAILPVLDRKQSTLDLMRVWGLIYGGNMLGAFLFSLIFVRFAALSGTVDSYAFEYYGAKMMADGGRGLFLGALFAGWLMGLLGWVVASSTDTIGRIMVISLITFVIGIGGLAHCIAGAVAAFCAWLGGDNGLTGGEVWRFLAIATIGNTIGGAVFVGMFKYGYITND
ncbi:formate/nitrite transporter family protein [Microbulbifer guangxiensis]|uniref:formate/nitrite transporter family protein n=1 Tax=Microbulbifer guangxiensis TaxID=2904249 RepID=UPI001F3A5161|nr:formate/nitrite transporter family protein [Microbulbifer guangxiensis]